MLSALVASRNARRFLPAAALLTLLSVTAPAHAQPLTFTLSGVIFQDGATASGSFVYNPTTDIFDAFDITTTPGTTPVDGSIDATGYNYTPGTAFGFTFSDTYYAFLGYQGNRFLVLDLSPGAKAPGTYLLVPGVSLGGGVYGGSSEFFTPTTARTITGGNLIVTGAAAAVPEPSQYAAGGMLGASLLLGMVRAKRRTSGKKALAIA